MKNLFLISTILTAATSCMAQSDGSNALFKFDSDNSSPKTIYTLGKAPEFPFLRNLSSPRQVLSAIKRNENNEFDNIMMAIGFTNGAKDLTVADITPAYVPAGTVGNMGSAGYSTVYAKLGGDASEYKAWKISSSTGSVYFMSKCGNAFYPQSGEKSTACANIPVNLTSEPKEVTLTSNGQKMTSTDNVYIYYNRKRHKRHETAYALAGVNDKYPSKPLLLSSTEKTDVVPETYRVSLSTPDSTTQVCLNKELDLTANINIEKTSSYTGYYPTSNKTYKAVSKRVYRKSERKMRKIERKERRVARLTKTSVEVKEG